MRLVILLGMLVGLCSALQPSGAIPASAQSQASATIEKIDLSEFPTANLTATVLGTSNKPSGGLKLSDFAVSEGGSTVSQLTAEEDRNGAVALVIAIDVSASIKQSNLDRAKDAATILLDSLRPSDQAALVSFGDTTTPLVGLTADVAAVKQAISGLSLQANTAFRNGLFTAVDTAASADAPGKAVVVLSDGEDYGDISSQTEDDVVKRSTDGGVQIYTIDLGTASPANQAGIFRDPAFTGGQYFESLDDSAIGTILSDIDSELRSRYLLSFQHDITLNGDPDISVVANVEGQPVTTQQSLCRDSTQPLVSVLGITDGTTVSGVTTISPSVVCSTQAMSKVEFLLDGKVDDLAETAPFEYRLLSDKLSRGEHRLQLTVTFVDGTVGASADAGFELSGSKFNPAYLLLVAGLAVMIGGIFLILWRRRRPPPQPSVPPTADVVRPDRETSSARRLRGEPNSAGGHLTVVSGPTQGQRYPIGQRSAVMGRGPECDILLAGASISREHAKIWWENGTYRIRDLGSTNGTRVNGQKISEASLAAGDRIEVSPYVLELSADRPPSRKAN
jgi:hypothetical protein